MRTSNSKSPNTAIIMDVKKRRFALLLPTGYSERWPSPFIIGEYS